MARRGGLNSDRSDGEKVKINRENWNEAYRLFAYVKPYKLRFILGLLVIGGSSLTTLSFPFFLKRLIDSSQLPNSVDSWDSPSNIAIVMVLILLLQMVFSFSRVYLFAFVGENALADLRLDLYQRLIRFPMQFFSERRVGELSSRISSDLSLIQDAVTSLLAEIIRGVLTLVIGIGLILFLSVKLTIIMLSVVPVVVLLAVIFGKYIRRQSRKAQDQLADSNTIVQETLAGISTVKSFANEWFERDRYKSSLQKLVILSVGNGKVRGLFISFMLFCLFGTIILVVWYGVGLMKAGMLSFGDLTAFVLYTSFVGGSMAGFADLYGNLQKTLGATQRVRELLKEPTEVSTIKKPNYHIYNKLNGAISFNDVGFNYPSRPDIPVLKSINFKIDSGKQIAFVGTSGAGKSTIASLILGFYKPSEGNISFDEKQMDQFEIGELRSQMAYVPQDILLFGGTIRENIAYGDPDASENQLIDAAKQAFAYDFIMEFPEGLDTIVGERGVKLSGGQRQRIAIARAILRNPSILILDEATSSLDSASETIVQEALNNLMKGRTSIVIAHRLSTIRDADVIYVLDKGTIKESGSHYELLKANGLYKLMVDVQND
jgi:ABC-type multidrug transport system fused ATPase/permease subunit